MKNTETQRPDLATGWESKYCSNHMGKAPAEGGIWLTSNQGKNKRWICAGCREVRRMRKELLARETEHNLRG